MEHGIMTNGRRCPYIIGTPINEVKHLFGRESLFKLIQRNLRHNKKFILLHGQRRIGKSSVLKQIPEIVGNEEFVFVHFDLQDKNELSPNEVLQKLIRDIGEQLPKVLPSITPPDIKEFEKAPYKATRNFLALINQKLNGRKLVFLLDEFDVFNTRLSEKKEEQRLNFFRYLKVLLTRPKNLFIIVVLGRFLQDVSNLRDLFKDAPYQEIGLLDELSAKRLIIEPAQGVLEYEPEAIKAILEMSAGHPYFTQVICFALFGRAREQEKWKVTCEDVEIIIDKAIELAEAGLAWFWDGLSQSEQVVFSAVAEAQQIAIDNNQSFPEDPFKLLTSYQVIPKESLIQAAKQLKNTSFLDNTGRRVKIEFVRRWLILRHPLKQEIWKLKKELQKLKDKKLHEPKETIGILHPYQSTHVQIFPPTRILFGIIAGVAVISSFISISISELWTKRCLEGQVKIVGIICVADTNKISRGERTFFVNRRNEARRWAIEAFKKNDYDTAIKRFETARKSDPKDPEVWIYYNNARAREKGETFTIAVIAPMVREKLAIDKEESAIAQEILRGVAQAQHQFNENSGLNGRLLEIAIANDEDQPEKAQEVAAELVQDSSVLGVIGHYSSDATYLALPKYKQSDLPVISFSTSTKLKGDVFFRAAPSDEASGKSLADYAYQDLDIRKVVIFFDPESPYSESIQQAFTKKFNSQGGEVFKAINLTEQLDAEQEIQDSLTNQVQAAVLFPSTQSTDIARQVAQANAKWMANPQNTNKSRLKLLGGDTLYADYKRKKLSKYKNAVEGLILAVPWFRDNPKSEKFAKVAERKWGGGVSWLTAAGFDATQAFLEALKTSPNFSRKTVLQGLPQVILSDQQTSGGTLKFTSEGERESEPVLVKLENGEFEFVK